MENSSFDRLSELKKFDDSKAGVKGLVDSGISSIPKIFIRPEKELFDEKTHSSSRGSSVQQQEVPVIDLNRQKTAVVDEIKNASEKWGFFQVVNHGIPESVLDGMLEAIRKFHELDVEFKKDMYSRDLTMKFRYDSNIDLYKSNAANWRDTMIIKSSDGTIVEHELPEAAWRGKIVDYQKHVITLGETLFDLLSEALELKEESLKEMECATARNMVCHYYPPCPEPELTLGHSSHTDPAFLTLLLQDGIGGLQCLHENRWIDVHPVAGSMIVNIGDLLQMVSNGKFKSVEHRVRANQTGPRISTACFFMGSSNTHKIYGPIKELISEDYPAKYIDFTVKDYITSIFNKSLNKFDQDHYKA